MTPYVTTRNAQEIANIIQYLLDGGDQGKRFELGYTDERSVRGETWISPILDEPIIDLANGSQLVRCITEDGESLDLLVPREHREFQPALVILSRDVEAEMERHQES